MRFPRKYARFALIAVAALVLLPLLALADPSTSSGRREVSPPRDAQRHQRDLTRHARAVWGMDAPVATFAAQIHQESRWRADARSPVGAQGMAQFMPATSAWISGVYRWGEAQPYNPGWALRALVSYDRWLWERVQASGDCERMAMALSAYNGGLGWVYRDQALAAQRGADRLLWFGHVERFNAGRSAANFAENRGYPRLILTRWQPIYAGWGGGIKC
jgi:soluble lytic murein transglycosylase-like protein